MPRLSFRDVSIGRSSLVLIEDFNADLYAGEIIALVGANGAGKSTLLHALAGLHNFSGTLLLEKRNVGAMSPQQRAEALTLLLQSSTSHPYCRALNRIAQGLIPHRGFSPWLDKKSQEAIAQCAQALNIKHLLERPLIKMSGGELRLINIAKCLVNDQTKLILLDEPSVFLDFFQKELLLNTLKQRAAQGALIIFSSHDRSFIEQSAQRVLSLSAKKGHLISVADFFTGPMLFREG